MQITGQCQNHPTYANYTSIDTWGMTNANAGTDPASCVHRRKQLVDWCGGSPGVMTTFANLNHPAFSNDSSTQCLQDKTQCAWWKLCNEDENQCPWYRDFNKIAEDPNAVAVMRVFDVKGTKLHLHTTWPGEVTAYVKNGNWNYDGLWAKLYNSQTSATMTSIYRVYDSNTGEHILNPGKPSWARVCKPNAPSETGDGIGHYCEGFLGYTYSFLSSVTARNKIHHLRKNVGSYVDHLYTYSDAAKDALISNNGYVLGAVTNIGYLAPGFEMGLVGGVLATFRDLTINDKLLTNPTSFVTTLKTTITSHVTITTIMDAYNAKKNQTSDVVKPDLTHVDSKNIGLVVAATINDLIAEQLLKPGALQSGDTMTTISGRVISGMAIDAQRELKTLNTQVKAAFAQGKTIASIIPGYDPLAQPSDVEKALASLDAATFNNVSTKLATALSIGTTMGDSLANGVSVATAINAAKESSTQLVSNIVADVNTLDPAIAAQIPNLLNVTDIFSSFASLLAP